MKLLLKYTNYKKDYCLGLINIMKQWKLIKSSVSRKKELQNLCFDLIKLFSIYNPLNIQGDLYFLKECLRKKNKNLIV